MSQDSLLIIRKLCTADSFEGYLRSFHQNIDVFQKVLDVIEKVLSNISMIIFSSYTFLFHPPFTIFAFKAKISYSPA
jgi:phosphoenolpyruvate carboxylase